MSSEALAEVKKLLILVGFFLVVFLTFFFLFWRPGLADLKKYQIDLKAKTVELAQLERDALTWPRTITREKIKQYENEMARLWDLIPQREEIALLLDEVQNHARASNLEIVSLIRSAEPKANPKGSSNANDEASKSESGYESRYEKVSYKIYLRGGSSGLISFLRRLEDSNRLIIVTNIEVKANDPKGTEKINYYNYYMDAGIQFNIFYTRPNVEKSMGVEKG